MVTSRIGLQADARKFAPETDMWSAVCECGRKAIINLRIDTDGKAVIDGAQTEIGGNDRYVAMCRKHFLTARHGATISD